MHNNFDKKPLLVGVSPHIYSNISHHSFQIFYIISLIPLLIQNIYLFQTHFILMIMSGILGGAIVESMAQFFRNRKLFSIRGDFIHISILMALSLPTNISLWLPFVGVLLGTFIGCEIFGGMGINPVHPVLLGRTILSLIWISTASFKGFSMLYGEDIWESLFLFITDKTSNLSVLLSILGGCFLLSRRVFKWRIPIYSILSLCILDWLLNRKLFVSLLVEPILFSFLFLMIDPVTTPLSKKGQGIYGAGFGILVFLLNNLTKSIDWIYSLLLLWNFSTLAFEQYELRQK